MSLIFDLDFLNEENDKKFNFYFNKKPILFHLKLKYVSVTWISYDIINEYSKEITKNKMEEEDEK